MANPAVTTKYGPYYESEIWRQLPQREAVGKAPMTPSQVAGATYGELEARYETVAQRQRAAREWMIQRLDQRAKEKAVKTQERGQAASGVGSILGTGLKAYQLFKPKSLASQGLLKSVTGAKTATPAIPETVPATEMTPIEGIGFGIEPEIASIPEVTGLAEPAIGLAETGLEATGATIAETTLAAPAISEATAGIGAGAEAIGGVATGVEAATGVAAGAELAGGAAATAGGVAPGLLAGLGVLGPIGLIVGGLGIVGSLLGGGKDED